MNKVLKLTICQRQKVWRKNISLKIVNIILIFPLLSDVSSNEEISTKFSIANRALVYPHSSLKI